MSKTIKCKVCKKKIPVDVAIAKCCPTCAKSYAGSIIGLLHRKEWKIY